MRSKSSNTFRTNIMLTERNAELAKEFFGGYSNACNLGIEFLSTFNISVYMIKHRYEKKCFVGTFDHQEVPDVQYHYVHDLGSTTLGHQIRRDGVPLFEFYVIGKFTNLKEANLVKRMFRKAYLKAGYTFLNKGFDLTGD